MSNIRDRFVEIQNVIEGEVLELQDWLDVENENRISFIDKQQHVAAMTKSINGFQDSLNELKSAILQIQ